MKKKYISGHAACFSMFEIYYSMCVWDGNIKMVREGLGCECVTCTDVVQERAVSALGFVVMNLRIYKSRKCPDQVNKAAKAIMKRTTLPATLFKLA
jgi:hypothetical protein